MAEAIWEELLGSHEWKGLLEPLDLSLRKLILQCGDMSEATYDAFIDDENSKYCGYSRYGMKSFFNKVFLPDCASHYQVVSFLYATSSIDDRFLISPKCLRAKLKHQSNWMGYIAVTKDQVSKANGRHDVYVSWHGTVEKLEFVRGLQKNLVLATPLMSGSRANAAEVMKGWLKIYTFSNPDSPFPKTCSAQTQLVSSIRELMKKYEGEKISLIFAGHSIGGVLAALSTFNVVETGAVAGHVPVVAFVFGCPRLGNKAFCDKLKALQNLRILHVRNERDYVPKYLGTPLGFDAYVGIELLIDSTQSPSLKTLSIYDFNNLEVMLHVVAGWNGKEGKFEPKVKRSLALLNKSRNFLKDEYRVPESWWVEKNKGMVLHQNGDWVEADTFQEEETIYNRVSICVFNICVSQCVCLYYVCHIINCMQV